MVTEIQHLDHDTNLRFSKRNKITSVNELAITTKKNKQGNEDLQTNCCYISCIAPNHVVLHTEL